MIYQICDVMSIITRDGVFLNISFEPQLIKSPTWPIDGHTQGQ